MVKQQPICSEAFIYRIQGTDAVKLGAFYNITSFEWQYNDYTSIDYRWCNGHPDILPIPRSADAKIPDMCVKASLTPLHYYNYVCETPADEGTQSRMYIMVHETYYK